MLAYILRRLALILPTLFGIMLINFVLVQFVPGGPIEQILAQLEQETDVFEGIAGGGGEIRQTSERGDYLGAQGLPEEFVAVANEKLAKINAAYDRISKERGFG